MKFQSFLLRKSMTPQERELIENVATKLSQAPSQPQDAEAAALIAERIGQQPDAIYKLTQAVLVQELALKELKQKNDYLEQSAAHYRSESERGAMSKMFGAQRPAPQPPKPVSQGSAFGGFMQTAAGVAAGMVAGHLISDMLFSHDAPTEVVNETINEVTDAPADLADSGSEMASEGGSFLGGSDFASEYCEAPGEQDFTQYAGGGGFGDEFAGDDFGGDFGGDDFGGDDDFA
ncbi:DUF2076 domain-containing protein [Halomonas denitrificans]|nr:DUF2076 domain-containing protein [Halomonas denitrificans]